MADHPVKPWATSDEAGLVAEFYASLARELPVKKSTEYADRAAGEEPVVDQVSAEPSEGDDSQVRRVMRAGHTYATSATATATASLPARPTRPSPRPPTSGFGAPTTGCDTCPGPFEISRRAVPTCADHVRLAAK